MLNVSHHAAARNFILSMLGIERKLKCFSFGFFHVISPRLKDLTQVGINASTGTKWLLTQTQKNIHRFILEALAQGFCFLCSECGRQLLCPKQAPLLNALS